MSFSTHNYARNKAGAFVRNAVLSVLTTFALSATALPAAAHPARDPSHHVRASEFRAQSNVGANYCVPANGAQILGGFAGPNDRLDPTTGEVCGL
jgi:hypothetical protein